MLAIKPTYGTEPFDQSLHVTLDGELRTPFALYVQLKPTRLGGPTFSQFRTLPAELQLHVLRACDSPTLFRLMQVSRAIRAEAKKLFWSDPDAWYCVDGNWLRAEGFPGYGHYAMDFLACVEQVEAEFEDIDDLHRDWEAEIRMGGHGVRAQRVEEQIHDFWQTLQRRFPRVVRVVVSESRPRRARESLPPHTLKRVVRLCPTSISASASFLQRGAGCLLERRLWRQAAGDTGTADGWETVGPMWTRHNILPPPKEFRGPVGAFEAARYKFRRLGLQVSATRFLLLEARERHQFDGRHEPFACPNPTCEAQFRLLGEWTAHALDSAHDRDAEPPDEVKALFARREERLKNMQEQDVHGAWERMRDVWGEEGSEKRLNAEQAFLFQLEHDPLYSHGSPAKKSLTLLVLQRHMAPHTL